MTETQHGLEQHVTKILLKNLLNSACLLKRRFIVIELQLLSENLIVFCSENVFIEKVLLKLRVKFFSLIVSSGITGKA